MLPCNPVHNFMNPRPGHPVLFVELFDRHAFFEFPANLNHFLRRQLRHSVVNPVRIPGPALGNHIPHIVSIRTQENVLIVDARRVVAMMTNTSTGRNVPVLKPPFVPEVHLRFAVDPLDRVAALVLGTRPVDALVFVDYLANFTSLSHLSVSFHNFLSGGSSGSIAG